MQMSWSKIKFDILLSAFLISVEPFLPSPRHGTLSITLIKQVHAKVSKTGSSYHKTFTINSYLTTLSMLLFPRKTCCRICQAVVEGKSKRLVWTNWTQFDNGTSKYNNVTTISQPQLNYIGPVNQQELKYLELKESTHYMQMQGINRKEINLQTKSTSFKVLWGTKLGGYPAWRPSIYGKRCQFGRLLCFTYRIIQVAPWLKI